MAVSQYNLGNIRDSSGKGFKSYGSYEEGANDQMRLLGVYQSKHGLNTLNGIINRWAPSTENNTGQYVNSVSQMTGIKPDQEIDLNDPAVMGKVAYAMARMEKGAKNVPLSQQQYIDLATKRTANPVSTLPKRQGALQGAELLTAKPQTQEQAVEQQAQPAYMTPQTDQDQQAYNAQQLQQNRYAQQQAQQAEYDDTQKAIETGTLGFLSLLGLKKNSTTTSAPIGYGGSAGADYSQFTQQGLQGLRKLNTF